MLRVVSPRLFAHVATCRCAHAASQLRLGLQLSKLLRQVRRVVTVKEQARSAVLDDLVACGKHRAAVAHSPEHRCAGGHGFEYD